MYIKKSDGSHEGEPASNLRSTSSSNLDQITDQWLYETSRKIEPDEKSDASSYMMCKQHPRTRNYSLKSPAPSTVSLQSSSTHKMAHKSPFEGVRSQSTNRLDAGKTGIVGKLTGQSTGVAASSSSTMSSSSSVNIKSKLNTVWANSSLNTMNNNNSVEFMEKKLHKRSNSSTQQNQLIKNHPPNKPTNTNGGETTNKISISALSTIKSVNLTTSGGLSKSNTSDDFLTSASCSSFKSPQGDAVVPLPSLIPAATSTVTNVGYLSSSSSPSPTLFVMPRNNTTFDTITFTSNVFNPDVNSSNVSLQKLSLSSADSSSSQPNSPPPNYEDVFELNTTASTGTVSVGQCFENRPYFQRNQSVLSTNSTTSASPTPLSNPKSAPSASSASANKPTASNIFSFSERDAQILDSMAPKYRPKAPPNDPPAIFRNRKPTLLQPPPIPPRSSPITPQQNKPK